MHLYEIYYNNIIIITLNTINKQTIKLKLWKKNKTFHKYSFETLESMANGKRFC
jgi:hypothetical protein